MNSQPTLLGALAIFFMMGAAAHAHAPIEHGIEFAKWGVMWLSERASL